MTLIRQQGMNRAEPMDPLRRTALVAGIFYLLTFAASIPALALYGPVLDDPDFILGAGGGENRVLWGGFLEVVTALTGIGTAVALFPVVRRQHEGFAIGFVTTRTLEAAIICAGVMSMGAIVTLRDDLAGAAGAEADSLRVTGESLVAMHDWSFLLGPGYMPVFNAICLGYLMYRSGLVPRIIPLMGLVGAPLLFASTTATMFGVHDQVSTTAFLAVLPVALWELSVGLWMTFKGFNPSPITGTMSTADTD
jgi:hypothetical protein